MSRGGFKITRTCDSERVDWLDSLAEKVNEVSKHPITAVESARARNQQSILDQITSIVSRQMSGFSSVEDKVQDYQDKTGLKEYIRKLHAQKNQNKKTAQEGVGTEQELPKIFNKFPENVKEGIKNFIRNKCETHHGNIQVPALVEEVSKLFRQFGVSPQDVNDMSFEKYISDQIIKAKLRHPSVDENNVNLGLGVGIENDLDSANLDAFEGLTPTKI